MILAPTTLENMSGVHYVFWPKFYLQIYGDHFWIFMKYRYICGKNTPKLKNVLVFNNYSQPLLLNVMYSVKYKKGTTPKSVFSISQTTPKSVFKEHRKVLTDLNVGSSGHPISRQWGSQISTIGN